MSSLRRVCHRALWLVAVAAVTQMSPAGAQAPGDMMEVQVAGQRARLHVTRHYHYPVVNVEELTPLWGLTTRSGVFLRAELEGSELAFEAGSPFFRHGEVTAQLANPPYEWGGAFWIPSEFVAGWLSAGAKLALAEAPSAVVNDPLPARVDPDVPWHIIIDPGHGGHDPGTLGDRSHEKDVVLDVGRLVFDELQKRDGVVPYMTRDTDVYVKHDLRSQYAVDRGGDLFVSIHANGVTDSRAVGFETIFLGPARSEEAREVALRENRAPEMGDGGEAPDELQFILTGLDRTENLGESRRFAGFIQNSIRAARAGRSPDRGVKQGPWWVLLGALARMPSVIVEIGFLSNQTEEAYLSGEAGQRAMARAIADAIIEYRSDVLQRFAPSSEGDGR